MREFLKTIIQLSCFLPILMQLAKAQTNTSPSDSLNGETEMVPGYIILENHTDTLWGLIAIETIDTNRIVRIKFKENGKKKIQKYGGAFKSDVRFFGTQTMKGRYVNWVDETFAIKFYEQHPSFQGWVKVIEEGKITVSIGFEKQVISRGGGGPGQVPAPGVTVDAPVFCLKKEGQSLALIKSIPDVRHKKQSPMLFKLSERSQLYLVSLLNDDIQVAVKIEYGEVIFADVLRAIQEYNVRAKEKK